MTYQLHPKRLLLDAIQNQSTTEISHALRLDPSLLKSALVSVVRKGSVSMTEYLLNTEHAPVHVLDPINVAPALSLELLKLLVSAGWDLNRSVRDGVSRKGRLVELVAYDEDIIKWCFEHGAEDKDPLKYPPLTEDFAVVGTVSCFKLIRAKGARIGRRTLHRAAKGAATCTPARRPEQMAMVRYLVEEERLDVNQMDTDGQLAGHYGTPIMYAAMGRYGEEVIRYLLAKGADPRMKDPWGYYDAFSMAKHFGYNDVVQIVESWTRQKSAQVD